MTAKTVSLDQARVAKEEAIIRFGGKSWCRGVGIIRQSHSGYAVQVSVASNARKTASKLPKKIGMVPLKKLLINRSRSE